MLLVHHNLKQLASELSLPNLKVAQDVDAILRNHDWPGNVRELHNVLERTVSSLEGDTINRSELPFYLHRGLGSIGVRAKQGIKTIKAKAEEEAIKAALKETNNNKARAARMLGIHRTLLYKKMARYGIAKVPT